MYIIKNVRNGWPSRRKCCIWARPYWNFRNELFVMDNILFKGYAIVVPNNLKRNILQKLHDGHLAITKIKLRAKDLVYLIVIYKILSDLVKPACVIPGIIRNNH